MSEEQLIICRAEPADVDVMFEIYREVVRDGGAHPREGVADRRTFEEGWTGRSVLYAARIEGETVGGYLLRSNFPAFAGHIAQGGYLVMQSARNRGVGSAMLAHSLYQARQLGYTAMMFNLVMASNPSRRLYESAGFKIIGRIPHAHGNDDGLIYWRSLADNEDGADPASRVHEAAALNASVTTVTAAQPGDLAARDEAARIWAAATACRDGDPDPAPLADARVLIDKTLDGYPRSMLLLAADPDGRACGFATAALAPDDGESAIVHFLGVDPAVWGLGVAGRLLAALPVQLRAVGFPAALLRVYADNHAAVAAYRRAGWTETGPAPVHPETGRAMLQFRLDLG